MIRIISSLLALITFATSSICQQQFIEVEVNDTIQVYPDEFIYMLTLSNNERQYANDPNIEKLVSKTQLDQIIKKYEDIETIEEKENTPMSLMAQASVTIIKLNSKSFSSFGKLKDELSKYRNVFLALDQMIVHDTKAEEIRLKRKLIEKARSLAEVTAKIVDSQIDSIHEIKEYEFTDPKSALKEKNPEWRAYPPLSGLGNMFGFPESEINKQIYTQKMSVKFILK